MPATTRRASRRTFLRSAAAAIAVPTIIPASALGLGGTTPPSDRINMGFVGLGGQGGGHLFGGAWTYLPGGYLRRDDVQVVGVCDVVEQRAGDAKRRVEEYYAEKGGQSTYSGCSAHTDIRELVADPRIDAVLIAAAYHAAATNSLIALRAGKDVYCEKPTSCTISEGRAVANTAKALGRVYQGGTQQRSEYDGKFRRAVELVRSGAIGKLERVYSYQGGGSVAPPPEQEKDEAKLPAGINWEAYVNCLPWFNYDGSTTAHRFGWGDINWGQHHIDIAQWGAGGDNTGPAEIRLEEGRPVFRYASGVEIIGTPPPGRAWDEGGATFVGSEGSITVHRNVLESDPPEILRTTPVPHDADVYYSTSHSGNFLECIRTRQPTICNAESTQRASSLLLLGGIAMQLGRTVKWDPVKELFPDDPEANRLLSFAPRAPWQNS